MIRGCRRYYCSRINGMERLDNGLYVVGIPIGNQRDVTERALTVLRSSDVILCENIKNTKTFLNQHNVLVNNNIKLISYHDPYGGLPYSFKNILDSIKYSAVSIVTDAGTPCISDPGHVLVRESHKLGYKVIGVPGASAVITALSVSGMNSDRFIFEGFLPSKEKERKKVLEEISCV